MYNERVYKLGSKRSTIREIFEYAKKRSGEIGAENVFDFSIGNPSVPAPEAVNEAIVRNVSSYPRWLCMVTLPPRGINGYAIRLRKNIRNALACSLRARICI